MPLFEYADLVRGDKHNITNKDDDYYYYYNEVPNFMFCRGREQKTTTFFFLF